MCFTSVHVYGAEAVPISHEDQAISAFDGLHFVLADGHLSTQYPGLRLPRRLMQRPGSRPAALFCCVTRRQYQEPAALFC